MIYGNILKVYTAVTIFTQMIWYNVDKKINTESKFS